MFLQEQRGSSDDWQTLKSGRLDANSNYSIAYRWRRPGERDVRVVFRSDDRNLRGVSDPVTVDIQQAQVPGFTISSSAPITDEGTTVAISGVLDQAGTTTPEPNTVVQLWGRSARQHRFVVLADANDRLRWELLVQPAGHDQHRLLRRDDTRWDIRSPGDTALPLPGRARRGDDAVECLERDHRPDRDVQRHGHARQGGALDLPAEARQGRRLAHGRDRHRAPRLDVRVRVGDRLARHADVPGPDHERRRERRLAFGARERHRDRCLRRRRCRPLRSLAGGKRRAALDGGGPVAFYTPAPTTVSTPRGRLAARARPGRRTRSPSRRPGP